MQRLKSLNRERIKSILNKVELFEGLSESEIELLYLENNNFFKTDFGEVFVREGEIEPFFYVLLAGKVVIYKNDDPKHILSKLSPGNFVGESSYFNHRARNANVRANGECILMKVDAVSIRTMPLDVKDKIKDQIILELARRVGNMNDSQLDLVNEARQTQKHIQDLENQLKRIHEEYPHIRTRFK